MTDSDFSAIPDTDLEIEQTLIEVEQSLNELESRYHQIKQDLDKKTDLIQQQKLLEQKKVDNPEKEPIKTQLHHIQQELEKLELNLESVLLPSLFWQVVRFVGIGIVIGWSLKAIAG